MRGRARAVCLLVLFAQASLTEANQGVPIISAFERALPSNPFFIPAQQVHQITSNLKIGTIELMQALHVFSRKFSHPNVGGTQVGKAAIGATGNIYLGVNLEFRNINVNHFIHGEVFTVANARRLGEKKLVALTLGGDPCGSCAQFLSELSSNNHLILMTPGNKFSKLSDALRRPYRSSKIKRPVNIFFQDPISLNPGSHLRQISRSPLLERAFDAANFSHTPYTQSPSGVAIKLTNGKIFSGPYLETSGYNTSVSPLQTALIDMVAQREGNFSDIREAALVEKRLSPISQEPMTRALLKVIGRKIKFTAVRLK